jgi:peptidoglycan/LPS O-acetylase OafA/YrhL
MTNRAAHDGKSKIKTYLTPVDFDRNHFNFLRLAMALLVIWSHSFALYYGSEDHEPISLLLNGAYNSGNIGVRVFFAISGFLITISFLRSRSLLSYLKKRVARIYPGFLVAFAICTLLIIPLFSTWVDFSSGSIARSAGGALVLRSYFPASDVFSAPPHHSPAVNGALWSIPFEFWCYLAVAAFGLTGVLRRRFLIVLALLVILAGRALLDIVGVKPGGGIIDAIIGWPYLWFTIAPCFLAGMIAYLYRDLLPRSPLLALALLASLIVSAHVSRLLCDALFPLVMAYLTFYVAFSNLALPDVAHHGDFSYGTYLYGFAIQQMLLEARLPFAVYIPVAIALSLGAGIASWFLVERHFLGRRRLKALAEQHGGPHEGAVLPVVDVLKPSVSGAEPIP